MLNGWPGGGAGRCRNQTVERSRPFSGPSAAPVLFSGRLPAHDHAAGGRVGALATGDETLRTIVSGHLFRISVRTIPAAIPETGRHCPGGFGSTRRVARRVWRLPASRACRPPYPRVSPGAVRFRPGGAGHRCFSTGRAWRDQPSRTAAPQHLPADRPSPACVMVAPWWNGVLAARRGGGMVPIRQARGAACPALPASTVSAMAGEAAAP
jgi:hypothetical protein